MIKPSGVQKYQSDKDLHGDWTDSHFVEPGKSLWKFVWCSQPVLHSFCWEQICGSWITNTSCEMQSSWQFQVCMYGVMCMQYRLCDMSDWMCINYDCFIRLILIAEKDTVYEKFPTPLINRLEKHFVLTSSVLEDWQEKVLNEFEEWIEKFWKTRCVNMILIVNSESVNVWICFWKLIFGTGEKTLNREMPLLDFRKIHLLQLYFKQPTIWGKWKMTASVTDRKW